MPIKRNWLEQGLLLFIEGGLFLTLSVFFIKWGGSSLHMFLAVLGIGVLLAGGFWLLVSLFQRPPMIYFYVLCIMACAIGWLLFSLPLLICFAFSLYFLWRLFQFADEHTYDYRWWLFLLTVGLILIEWAAIKEPAGRHELLLILIFQSIVIVGFEMVQEWRLSKRLSGSLTYLFGFIGVAFAGVILTLLFPYIKWVFNLLLSGLLAIVLVLVQGLWFLMSHLLGKRVASHRQVLNNLLKNSKNNPKVMPAGHPHFNPIFLFILLAVGLLVVAYLIMRRWQLNKGSDSKSPQVDVKSGSVALDSVTRRRLFNYLSTPKDPIRAQVFRLQKKWRKNEAGRFKHETIEEWLIRISAKEELRLAIQSVYEAVRYGGTAPSLSDTKKAEFEKAIETVDSELKKRDRDKRE